MDRIMSTSIILLDQNFNTNYVDIIVFKPSVLLPLAALYINRWHGPSAIYLYQFFIIFT